ncbi:MAG TPA: two-component system response regulator, partial [Ruminiclostridium sp.]|nr:two-component system response regulator [Ruminiclostridium sp.]
MMQNSAILCVDDDEMIVVSLKQELMSHFGSRFQYETALNAQEAMNIIDDLVDCGVKVILILSDWLMPGMNGDEFLVKVNEKYPEIKALIVTGYMDMAAISPNQKKINL